MKKQIRQKEESNVKSDGPSEPGSTPLPQYLLDRNQPTNAKALSSAIKNKRNEKVNYGGFSWKGIVWLTDSSGSQIQCSAPKSEGDQRGGDVQSDLHG